MKKYCYVISLIKEILTLLKNVKYFIKIDISQAFYKIRIFQNSKYLTTFMPRFGVLKY